MEQLTSLISWSYSEYLQLKDGDENQQYNLITMMSVDA